MKWTEITILTNNEGIEPVIARLDSIGLTQVVIEQGPDAIAESLKASAKYWDFADANMLAATDAPCVRVYIADLAENSTILERVHNDMRLLKSMELGIGTLEVRTRTIAEEDWANNWKAYYKPTPIGHKLMIKPSWEPPIDDLDGRTILQMDPGMAFGTGTHNTTRMCLELIEETLNVGSTVLDLGCGSGILSIAALLLGARQARLFDIDPIAKRVVADNMKENNIPETNYETIVGDVIEDKAVIAKAVENAPYGMVVANIVAGVLISIMPLIARVTSADVPIILSGIIDDRLAEVKIALDDNGLVAKKIVKSQDWYAILAYKL